MSNMFQERLRELEAAQSELSEVRVGSNMLQRAGAKAIAASKKAAKERELAAAAEPKDKITHKDVLVKRGVLKAESIDVEQIEELDQLALRGLHTANPQSIPNYLRSTEKGKKAAASRNVAALKDAIKKAKGAHHKPVLPEEVEQIDELLNPEMGAGEYVKDFQKSDAPQFEGKSKKKRQKMAIAAYLSAKRKMSEQSEDSEKNEMAMAQLHFIKYAAEEIMEYIDMGGEVEEWYQNKLSKVHSDMESLHSNMEGEARRTGMKEEVDHDQLVELSKKTLGYYVKAASHDVAARGAATRQFANDSEEARKNQDYNTARKKAQSADKMFDKSWKRRQSMAKAVDRLTKEDLDLVAEGDDRYHGNYDELSRSRQRFHAKPYIPYSSAAAKKAPNVDGRHYHKVPFHQKDDAKKEGMRFDSEHKMWYHTSTEKSKASKFSKAE